MDNCAKYYEQSDHDSSWITVQNIMNSLTMICDTEAKMPTIRKTMKTINMRAPPKKHCAKYREQSDHDSSWIEMIYKNSLIMIVHG